VPPWCPLSPILHPTLKRRSSPPSSGEALHPPAAKLSTLQRRSSPPSSGAALHPQAAKLSTLKRRSSPPRAVNGARDPGEARGASGWIPPHRTPHHLVMPGPPDSPPRPPRRRPGHPAATRAPGAMRATLQCAAAAQWSDFMACASL
jgi:hypothetical protein